MDPISAAIVAAIASGVGFVIQASSVPVFETARKVAETREGGGLRRNRTAREALVHFADGIDETTQRLMFDPQTSGGLLIALAPELANDLIKTLKDLNVDARVIGDVVAEHSGEIQVI